jgi:hypothetical protein
MIIKNKKGDEKVLSVVMFAVWGIIALTIVIGTSLFYGGEADVRTIQSRVLVDRIADCLIEDSNVKNMEDYYSECNLDKELFDKEKLYLKISFFELKLQNRIEEPIILGNKDLETQCNLRIDQNERKSSNFARCSTKEFYGVKNQQNIRIEIIAGSNNQGGDF